MSHLVSAPSVEVAGNLLKKFNFEVLPEEKLPAGTDHRLKADERCIAVIVECATNVAEVAKLRPEVGFWQMKLANGLATAPQIATFLQKIVNTFAMTPQYRGNEGKITTTLASPAEFGLRPMVVDISKAALEASRFLFSYYRITPKRNTVETEEMTRLRVATLAESNLGFARAMRVLPIVIEMQRGMAAGKLSEMDIKRRFRQIGVLLEYLPNYEDRREESKIL